MAYEKFSVGIGGDKLLMHNGRLANPADPIARAMAALPKGKKATDADLEQLSNVEYEGGLYLNARKEVVLPGRLLEAVIAEGARASKEGKIALASTYVDLDALLAYEGGPLSVEELVASPDHRLTVGVRVGQSKVMRTRPLFRNWSVSFVVELDTGQANPDQLQRWIVAAGQTKGIGDWRPRHGRYEVVSFAAMKKPVRKVA